MKAKVVPTSPKERIPAEREADVDAFMRDATSIAKPTVVRFSLSFLVLVVSLGLFAGLVGATVFAYGRDQWPWLAQWFGTPESETSVVRTTTKTDAASASAASAVQRVQPSVVSIFVRRVPAKGSEVLAQMYLPEDYRGAGVIVTEDGIGVTTRRTIPDLTKEVAVVTSDRTVFLTKDFSVDPASDAVFFRVSGKGFPVVDFADVTALLNSQPVVTVSLDATTLASVAATTNLTTVHGYRVSSRSDLLRSTERLSHVLRIARATAVPAEPAFTYDGKLIGLQTGTNGDVLPVDVVASGLERVQRSGGVSRNLLGVRYVDLPIAKGLLLSPLEAGTRGALVTGDDTLPAVTADSPASRAGIQAGDVILRIDDRAVGELPSLAQLIQSLPARSTVTCTVLRDGEEKRIPVTLDVVTP